MVLTFPPLLFRAETRPTVQRQENSAVSRKAVLSERYNEAMIYAARLHRNHVRKHGNVPYIAHLQSVAALVLKNGGSEEEAIAAWLHDAVEDQGGWKTLQDIQSRFGEQVAELVKGCSDSFTDPPPPLPRRMANWWRYHRETNSIFRTTIDFGRELIGSLNNALSGQGQLFPEMRPPWLERKKAYIAYLKKEAPASVLLISACDKLDNLHSQLEEYRLLKEEHWRYFSGGKKVLQYFEAAAKAYEQRGFKAPVTEELMRKTREFRELVEKTTGAPLPSTNIFDGV